MTIMNMVGGGNSIKVPLNDISNLSAEAGSEEATITRTDVGNLTVNGVLLNEWDSTKLVRKTGSAPISSTDGTLVLTETIENTYSSNGYTDTGLTDGTTYYYKAFSVGSNGLESSSNTAEVEPGGWKPGANTLFYYPLSQDCNDYSGNNRNLTNNNITFSERGGVVSATFNGSNSYAKGSPLTFGNTFTILARYWHISGWGIILSQDTDRYPQVGMGYINNNVCLAGYSGVGYNLTQILSNNNSNNGKRVLGAFVFDNGSAKLYEGTTTLSNTASGSLAAPSSSWNFYLGARRAVTDFRNGSLREVIGENVAWSEDDLQKYLKSSKKMFGL